MLKIIAASIGAFTLPPETASERYVDCLALVEIDLKMGRQAAQDWVQQGGGANAHHCLAMADLAAGFHRLGATRLFDISERRDAGDDFVRARLLAQSAEAWLKAENSDAALEMLTLARELAPESGDLSYIAARIYAADEKWHQSIAEANDAIAKGFKDPEIYITRARGHIAHGDHLRAADDVVSALTIDAYNIDALTLRGEIQQAGIEIEVFYGEEQAQ